MAVIETVNQHARWVAAPLVVIFGLAGCASKQDQIVAAYNDAKVTSERMNGALPVSRDVCRTADALEAQEAMQRGKGTGWGIVGGAFAGFLTALFTRNPAAIGLAATGGAAGGYAAGRNDRNLSAEEARGQCAFLLERTGKLGAKPKVQDYDIGPYRDNGRQPGY